MYCITDQQVEYILNDIRRNGIEMEDLQLNLLDHVCCIMEQKLKETDDFERFYHETIKQFYKRELREIEEETIYLLTFKNYYVMKKVMMVSGTLSAAALVFGSFFKVMHWPGASVLLSLGIIFVTLIFLPILAVLKAREVSAFRDKFVALVGSLLGVLYGLSTLFAVQHWNGRTFLWLATVIVSMFVFIPVYFFTGIRKPEARTNTIVTSVLLVGVTALLFVMIRIRPNYMQNNMMVNTYLHNEQLLKNMQQGHMGKLPVDSALAVSINSECEEMKSMILQQEINMTVVPRDFEERKLLFNDRVGNEFDGSAKAHQLVDSLKAHVIKYNSLAGEEKKIPLVRTVLNINEMADINSLDVLTNITQMQMFLVNPGVGNAVSLK